MTLNIYNKGNAEKTYVQDTYNLLFGTLEDVAEAVNLDSLQTGDNNELIKAASSLVMNSMDTVKELMKDIFPGITDEELRRCSVAEMAAVIIDVVKYTVEQIGKGVNRKN